VHPGDLAGGFSDLEMTWLLYCAGAATANKVKTLRFDKSHIDQTTHVALPRTQLVLIIINYF